MSGDRNSGRARPNILLVTVDQWPAHLLGAAGHGVVETPTLDHLARLGTRYTNVYAECPICIPARRTLMTGLSPRGHGDRDFQPLLPMPEGVPTLARVFREGGYQTSAVGKLHVYPQRDRIGFEEVLLAEEGRAYFSGPDDYDLFLADRGAVGRQFLHGMSNNDYGWRPWHLPEELHVTNWITFAAARQRWIEARGEQQKTELALARAVGLPLDRPLHLTDTVPFALLPLGDVKAAVARALGG